MSNIKNKVKWPTGSQWLSLFTALSASVVWVNAHWDDIAGVPGLYIPPNVRAYIILAGIVIPPLCRSLLPHNDGGPTDPKAAPTTTDTGSESQ
jgi:hypothetical protein